METSPTSGTARAADAAARRLRPAPGGNPALDRLSALAARLLGTTAAQVSLVADVQTVAGGSGLAPGAVGSEGPREESLCTVTAVSGAPLVVPDAVADARVRDLPPVTSGRVGSYLGVPLTSSAGDLVGAMCAFDRRPRTWSPADVALLEQLAASAVAELELSALSTEYHHDRVVWELAIDAAGVGTFDWDLRTGELRWDDRLLRMFGFDRAGFGGRIEAFNERVHPDDVARVTRALQEAIDTCGTYEAEYRVVLPDGRMRWVAAAGRALAGEDGTAERVLGAAHDVSGVREGEARVARVLETMSTAFYALDHDWRFTYVNPQAERVLGRPRDELLGGVVWELFPAAVGSDFEAQYRHAAQTGQPVAFDAHYPAPLDAWYEVRAWPGPDGLSVYFLDVTERRRAQEAAAAAARRVALLAEVTAELTGTLDAEEAVGRLARLVAPALGDWCLVTLVDDDHAAGSYRGLRDVGAWHADPAQRPVVTAYSRVRLGALTDESFLARTLRAGRPVQVRERAARAIRGVLREGEARDLLDALDPASAVFLPLAGRGRTTGLLSVFRGPGRAPVDGDDLRTLQEVASRAGLALDSARLYRQQRDLAEGLQRSLLSKPPEPDHVHVVVRYAAAAEAAKVGGDWYDAFLQEDGATVLVIGDVIGHDTAAAAAMGQVRGLLRGIAATTGEGPAAVLRRLDRAMDLLQVGTSASAVVARVEQDARQRQEGTSVVRWSNAGHPPPFVLRPDGSVELLAQPVTDLLLGVVPDGPRHEAAVELPRGSTVLLYTDGLVERRGQSLDEGMDLLRRTLEDLAPRGLDLDALCDETLARMLPPERADDVALVAVRLYPQDRPRPAVAGPNRVPARVPDDPA
ncbi:SpoIIE family protein phosphatase [Vallicoccus soli]|uniref:GAF domain-containing protein n=1 Tax=Vallicoccus soli TaxID=2339232 RepID=A0A3A3YS87_9ACTN|nr:SpoIIE family protein phosphatase [Vallicoccus soli]RJK94270.1 GAF domain-containing protein [Vallicoccus soli]